MFTICSSAADIESGVLKAYTEETTDDYYAYRKDIVTITFLNSIDETAINAEDTIAKWDVSVATDGSVMAFIKLNENETTKYNKRYDLYVAGNGGVKANPDSSNLFCEFTNLKTINGMEYFNTSSVTDMGSMFDGCSNLTKLDLSNFDTSNVSSMVAMFNNCSNLTELDLNSFNTSNLVYMQVMFRNCSSLKSLDLNHFDTSKVYDMAQVFYGCSSLTDLKINNWNTENVATISYMFEKCSSLTEINLSNWNTKEVYVAMSTFKDCSNLETIYVGDNWTTDGINGILANSTDMFKGCVKLKNFNEKVVDKTNAHCGEGGYLTHINPTNDTVEPPVVEENDNTTATNLNFFQKIIQWFKNLFAKLFG
jgi:surface protein